MPDGVVHEIALAWGNWTLRFKGYYTSAPLTPEALASDSGRTFLSNIITKCDGAR